MEVESFANNISNSLSNNIVESQIKGVLTYGSLICLGYTEESSNNSTEYFAYSEGLTETKVYLETRSNMQEKSSYMRGIFRVYPSFYHDAYMKGKNKFEEIVNGGINDQLDKKNKRAQIPKLMKEINEELALNLDIYEKLKGTPVRYGQVIQLLHVVSQKYLSYDPESPSDLESDCLKIELKYENSEYTCFRVMPSFKYQQESQGYIFTEDVVYLMSTVDTGGKTIGDPYLHASRTIGVPNDEIATMVQVEKKEVNISNDRKTMWSVKIFSDYINEKLGVLTVGDIIWINLSEEDKSLVIQSHGEKENQDDCRFIVSTSSEKYKKFVGNSNGMFMIQSTDMSKGGLVEWGTPYRLKHLTTNKYLAIGTQQTWNLVDKKDIKAESLRLVPSENLATNFTFEILYSTISSKNKQFFLKYIPKDAYFRIKSDKGTYLTYWNVLRDDIEVQDQIEGDYFTIPLMTLSNENNIYYCTKSNQTEVLMTTFLVSCKKTIQDSLRCLKPEFLSLETVKFQELMMNYRLASTKMEKAKDCLFQLEKFCRNKLLDYLSVDHVYGHTNTYVQDVLKEQLFIELLVQMLIFAFPTHQDLKKLMDTEKNRKERKKKNLRMPATLFNAETSSPHQDSMHNDTHVSLEANEETQYMAEILEDINLRKKQVCKLTYKLITAICDDNIQNKNYLFKYLPLFQMQAEFISNAIDCVNIILKDNEELLLNLHRINQYSDSRELAGSAGLKKNPAPQAEKSLSKRKTTRKGGTGIMTSQRLQEHVQIGEDVYLRAYENYYNKMASLPINELAKLFEDWNAIQFFATLIQMIRHSKRQKILSFFKTICVQEGRGININQETAFKYFTYSLEKSKSLMGSQLLKLFTKDKKELYVIIPLKGFEESPFRLDEFLGNENGSERLPELESLTLNDDSSDDENPLDRFRPTERVNQELLVTHLDLCDAFCKSRNFSWSKRLEKEITWEALLDQLKKDLPDEVRASINRLLISLYIDQEPRREVNIPILCKISIPKKKTKTKKSKEVTDPSEGVSLVEMTSERRHEDVHLDLFKAQLLDQIKQLETSISNIPERTNKNALVFDKKFADPWSKIYNSYILEVVQTIHLMLKFKKIKIKTKEITINPLPKKSDILTKLKKTNIMTNFPIDFFKKDERPKSEFESIIKCLIQLLEYDKTYPEAKRMLVDLRAAKKKEGNVVKNLFSTNIIKGGLQGIAGFAKDLVFKKEEAEKAKKKTLNLDFLDKEMSSNELYLKQADVLKRILEDLLGEQEIEIEIAIKMKILDILDYFFDFKQDKLFSNLSKVFLKMVEEVGLIKTYREDPKSIPDKIDNVLPHYIKYILPKIMNTGTAVDKEDVDQKEDILDINEILGFEILPVLVQQLSLNDNKAFEKKVLHLMLKIYNQREEFANLAKNMLLLFKQKDIVDFMEAEKQYNLLLRYTEESENWLTSSKLDIDKLETTNKILTFFYNRIFSKSPNDEELDFDPTFLEKDLVNKTCQDMYRHLRIYIPVISLIKDNIHIVEVSSDKKIQELFRRCFAFLAAFVKENEENQLILSNSIIVFLYKIQSNLGHVRLLIEIFRDNYFLCTNKIEEVLNSFVRLILTSGRKAEYLEFFKVIQKVKGKLLNYNQRLVLDTLLDPTYKNTLLYLASDVDFKDINLDDSTDYRTHFINIFGFEKAIFSRVTKAGDEPFYYHAELLDCLAMTAVGKESLILNETRLRSTFEFGYLLELLCEEDNFTSDNEQDHMINEYSAEYFELLKTPIINYIYYVYQESEKVTDEIAKEKGCVQKLLEKEYQRLVGLKCYKDTYLVYLFDHLLVFFHWYFKQGILTKYEESNTSKQDFRDLIRFVKALKSNVKKFDAGKISDAGKKNFHDLLIFLEADKGLEHFFLVKGNPKNEVLETVESYGRDPINASEDSISKVLWNEFLQVFRKSEHLTEAIDKEKKVFAKALMNITEMTSKDKVMKTIMNNEEVIKKLINFIIDNENNDETTQTVFLILDALGNIIENEETEEGKIEKQNFLNRNNSVYMIFSKLSDPNLTFQDELWHKLMHFAIKLLDGGNSEVQKNIYIHFTNFSNSEFFFVKIHERFLSEIQTIKKLLEDPNITVSEKENDQMKDILRLLQLFAEGHFSELQNYIRQQTNSHHSYDLLANISDLLNVYMQVKHTKFFETMIQCFDTLIEFIQGPCFENQVAVLQSSFLDLASNLLSIDERAEEMMIQQGLKQFNPTSLEKWQIARLKYKCSLALLSLLEAYKDKSSVHRMMKSLLIEVLHKNIADIFRLFKIQEKGLYTKDVFLHFERDPVDKQSREYCSLIIETGFNLFFLLNIFQEAQPPGEVQEEIKANNKKNEMNKVFKDNIVAKWGQVLVTLLKTGFTTIQNVGASVYDGILSNHNYKFNDNKDLKQEHAILLSLALEREEILEHALDFFKKNTAHIEVLRADNHLEKCYFSIPPFCNAITKDTKVLFNAGVDRISAKTKCDYLLKQSDKFIEIIKYEYWLKTLFNRIKFLGVLTNNISLWKDTAFIITIVLNLLVLFSYQRDPKGDRGFSSDLDEEIRLVGVIQIVLSLFIVVNFLITNAPLLIKKSWKGQSQDKFKLLTYIVRSFKTIISVFRDFRMLFYIFYGASAVLGVFFTPLFFSLHLFDVLMRYPTLQNVLQSIWGPRKSLLLTFLLLQILNYFFTLFGYYFLYEDYRGYCNDTWTCFLTAIDKAFKYDGGLGGFLGTNDNIDILRFAFDNIYNLVIMIIAINIVAGLIIDTFGSLREEEKKYQNDITNICFICGFDRETLDKASDARSGESGFENHIKKDHYLWNYLFYIAYIKDKKQTEYTGLESYIAEQINNEEISWFPTHRALVLKGQETSEDENIAIEALKRIEDKQIGLAKTIGDMTKNISGLENLVKKRQVKKKKPIRNFTKDVNDTENGSNGTKKHKEEKELLDKKAKNKAAAADESSCLLLDEESFD